MADGSTPTSRWLGPSDADVDAENRVGLALSRLRLVIGTAVVVLGLSALASLLRQPNLGSRAGADRPVWLIGVGAVVGIAALLAASWERLGSRTHGCVSPCVRRGRVGLTSRAGRAGQGAAWGAEAEPGAPVRGGRGYGR